MHCQYTPINLRIYASMNVHPHSVLFIYEHLKTDLLDVCTLGSFYRLSLNILTILLTYLQLQFFNTPYQIFIDVGISRHLIVKNAT